MPTPARKYDPGDRAAKKEEMRRLAEMKRAREAAAADPLLAAAKAAATAPPKRAPDPTTEGRAAKVAEQRALEARRRNELLYGVRMRVAEQSRWKEQAEAQEQTVASRLRDLFGDAKNAKPAKSAKGRRRK